MQRNMLRKGKAKKSSLKAEVYCSTTRAARFGALNVTLLALLSFKVGGKGRELVNVTKYYDNNTSCVQS
eukprot:6162661-Pyramimonas_sp.AAC.1